MCEQVHRVCCRGFDELVLEEGMDGELDVVQVDLLAAAVLHVKL